MNSKPLLLLGADGQVGRAWRELLTQQGCAFVSAGRKQVDLTDDTKLAAIITSRWSGVVNCAAYTDVDGAETAPRLAMQINARAPAVLARLCRQADIPLVHYSTDYVFDGCQSAPYAVDAPPGPINVYGQSKLAGERAVIESGCRHLIVRTSWVYAPWGRNFVRTMARLCQQRDQLRVVADQCGRPTSSEHLAASTFNLLQRGQAGVWHITDADQCSWHQLACAVAARINPRCQVAACSTDEFPRPARRPALSMLDLSRTERELGPMPRWQTNLRTVLDRLEEPL